MDGGSTGSRSVRPSPLSQTGSGVGLASSRRHHRRSALGNPGAQKGESAGISPSASLSIQNHRNGLDVDGPSGSFPFEIRPFQTAPAQPVKASLSAPSKALSGFHGSIGPSFAFATVCDGSPWVSAQTRLRPKPPACLSGTGLKLPQDFDPSTSPGQSMGLKLTQRYARFRATPTPAALWKTGLTGITRELAKLPAAEQEKARPRKEAGQDCRQPAGTGEGSVGECLQNPL